MHVSVKETVMKQLDYFYYAIQAFIPKGMAKMEVFAKNFFAMLSPQ